MERRAKKLIWIIQVSRRTILMLLLFAKVHTDLLYSMLRCYVIKSYLILFNVTYK